VSANQIDRTERDLWMKYTDRAIGREVHPKCGSHLPGFCKCKVTGVASPGMVRVEYLDREGIVIDRGTYWVGQLLSWAQTFPSRSQRFSNDAIANWLAIGRADLRLPKGTTVFPFELYAGGAVVLPNDPVPQHPHDLGLVATAQQATAYILSMPKGFVQPPDFRPADLPGKPAPKKAQSCSPSSANVLIRLRLNTAPKSQLPNGAGR